MNTVRFESTHEMLKQFRKTDPKTGKRTRSISYRDATPTLARVLSVIVEAAHLRDILKVYMNEIIEAGVSDDGAHLILKSTQSLMNQGKPKMSVPWTTRFKAQSADWKSYLNGGVPLEIIDVKLSDHDQDAAPPTLDVPDEVVYTGSKEDLKQMVEEVKDTPATIEPLKAALDQDIIDFFSQTQSVMCQCERAPLIDQTADPQDMSNWCQMCEDEMENFKVVDEKFEKQARPYHDDDREGETVAKLQHTLNRVRQERDQAQREVEAWQQAIMVQGYGIEEYLQDMTERLPDNPNRYDFADWSSEILTDIETDIQTDYAEAMGES